MDKALYCFVKRCVYLGAYNKELSGEIDLSVSMLNCWLHIGLAGWDLASGGWEACRALAVSLPTAMKSSQSTAHACAPLAKACDNVGDDALDSNILGPCKEEYSIKRLRRM